MFAFLTNELVSRFQVLEGFAKSLSHSMASSYEDVSRLGFLFRIRMSDLRSEDRAKILESARFQVGFQILKTFKFPKVRTSEIVTKCYQGLGIRVSDPVQIL